MANRSRGNNRTNRQTDKQILQLVIYIDIRYRYAYNTTISNFYLKYKFSERLLHPPPLKIIIFSQLFGILAKCATFFGVLFAELGKINNVEENKRC